MKAQEWLEKNYPDKETGRIYLNQQLEGILDCSEYKRLGHIFIPSLVDRSKLEIRGGSYKDLSEETKETKIIPCALAQTWLDQNYPKNGTCIRKHDWKEEDNHQDFGKTREEIKELDIDGKVLDGTLDLTDFKNLERLYCSSNYLTNLNLNNCRKLKTIFCSNNQLTTLNLSNLAELEKLICSNNYLTQIPDFPYPEKTTWLGISDNNLSPSNLTIFSQFRNLEELYIGNWDKNQINQGIYNRFVGSCKPCQDLNKLEILDISNIDLDSGWEYLPTSLENFKYDTKLRPNCKLAQAKKELEKELWKDIHQDFISDNKILKKDWLVAGFNKEQTKKFLEEWSQLEFKPEEGAFINWFLNFKKLDLNWACENEEEFRSLRNGYEYFGTCPECRQPNTSANWCQSCNTKHFRNEFGKWDSGNSQIDKFIQKCQLEATSPWNLLEWIPYEQFSNIEHVAQGGFGKVEKAKWEEGSIKRWDDKKKEWWRRGDRGIMKSNLGYKTVALKTLSNSQQLNTKFLQELTLYKMFRSEVSNMVPCYGVSGDPEGNYILVMHYMKEGNLREYLRRNYQKLEFYDYFGISKLNFLKQISQGLKDIHRKQLVHRDFHSGNIIVDNKEVMLINIFINIADLGLSKPVQEVKWEGKIYGVMPYVAPEVLQGEHYTQASDVYSFGIVAYEILTCLPPFCDSFHDSTLGARICNGLRPQFPEKIKYPQILVDLIKKCWDSEPNNRPSAREISGIVGEWFEENSWELKKDTEFYRQFQATKAFNETLPEEIKYPTYQSKEVWHSKPINTKQITHLLESHNLTLELDNLSIQDPQEENSIQAQIEISPKK